MTPQLSGAGTSFPITLPIAAPAPRAMPLRALMGWSAGAVAAFHLAYELCPPLIVVFLFCMFRVAHATERPHAMYAGWLIGLAVYGPQLSFFWTIFSFSAIGLWLVLGTWLALYLVAQRFALLKSGPRLGALAAPFLWTGFEFLRSELYPLKFSWLNSGYSFAAFPQSILIPWLGMYGVGFVLMLLAAQFPFASAASSRKRWAWTTCASLFVATGIAFTQLHERWESASVSQLKVAGVQLEFPSERAVVRELDALRAAAPETHLYVLSEYTFFEPVPDSVKAWCKRNGAYLVAGGKQYLDRSREQFRNTAFVIGPDGNEIFSQVKAVPIQFFNDGLPAQEQKVWDSPWGKLGLVVCYDLSYTRVTDELIRQGAQAIIAPTMDVEEWGERQHRLHARVAPVRAAEYGVPIFRLCSSGISQAVRRDGSVVASAPFPGQSAAIRATLDLPLRGRRPVDRFLVWPCVALAGAVLGWMLCAAAREARVLRLFRARQISA